MRAQLLEIVRKKSTRKLRSCPAFSSIHSDKLAAFRPGTCDGVPPLKSGSAPGHKNACVRPVRMSSGPSVSFFDWRKSGMTELAMVLVDKAPVIVNRLMTNLLSGGRSAIRSCISSRCWPHLRSGGE
jgi:hypothetical protein